MKILVALVAALALAAPAMAAPQAKDPRVPALQQKVAALQGQVAQLTQGLQHETDLNTCSWTYQSHYNYAVLNILAIMTGRPQISDTTGSDGGACARVGLAPPTYRSLSSSRSPFDSMVFLLSEVASR